MYHNHSVRLKLMSIRVIDVDFERFVEVVLDEFDRCKSLYIWIKTIEKTHYRLYEGYQRVLNIIMYHQKLLTASYHV